jgi:hypothetical protein
MSKQLISVILALAAAIGLMAPAFAAETGTKTIAERIAAIEETYDIVVLDGRKPDRDWAGGGSSDKADFEKNLTELEKALGHLGAVFTKKLSRSVPGEFEVYLLFGSECPDAYKGAVGIAHETYIEEEHDSWIEFLGPAGTSLSAGYMLHEFGHCMEFLLSDDPPDDFTSLTRKPFSNSAYTRKSAAANRASSKPSAYASLRAEMDSREDYAECFRVAVLNGGTSTIGYGKDTDIYKKTYEVYMDVAAFAGYGARATKRVAAYLGVKLPE